MRSFRMFAVLIAAMLGLTAMMAGGASASSARSFTAEQQTAFQQFGLTSSQISGVVVDSAMTRDEAIGPDSIVPAESLKNHHLIKPFLVVVPLVYRGYDNRIHIGQMVVHRYMTGKILGMYLTMWKSGFPVKSTIPESKFGYVDLDSEKANNSSGYRPEFGSEHSKGSSFDINPVQNPFDVTAYDPTRPVEPPGAHYDPAAKGTIVLQGPVQKFAAAQNLEWGGNWGNPAAIPQTDFFRVGYFDWMHFQLDVDEYYTFEAQLPPGFQS